MRSEENAVGWTVKYSVGVNVNEVSVFTLRSTLGLRDRVQRVPNYRSLRYSSNSLSALLH